MKFNPTTYDARVDSSPGSGKTDLLVINTSERTEGEGDKAKTRQSCLCGCGEFPVGKGAFVPGHDMRLRGKLTRAHLAGIKVEVNGKSQTPRAYAQSLDNAHLVESLEAAKTKFDADQATKATKAEARKAEKIKRDEAKAKAKAEKQAQAEKAAKAKAAADAKAKDEAVERAEREAAKS